MRLLLMRHGIAADLDDKIKSDAERPLTSEGKEKTAQVAAGLRACGIVPDLIATSPLLRAVQTAKIVRTVDDEEESAPQMETWEELEHADYPDVLQRLKQVASVDTVLLVGHEPGMSRLATHLLTGSEPGFAVDFKKAGICAIDLSSLQDAVPTATLLWHATPKQLRLMRK